MQEFSYVITDPVGIHARPAGLLAKEAGKYQSKISISNAAGKTAEVKRLMAVMSLAIKCGDTVRVTIDGADEEAAAPALEEFFKQTF